MDDVIFINKRTKIYNLIKKISDYYGGDDQEWLREYAREVIEMNKHDLQPSLECFLDLERQIDEKVNYVLI